MATTAEDYQRLIIAQVGDNDAKVVANNIAVLWAINADRDLIGPGVRVLVVKRECIKLLMGAERQTVDRVIDGNTVLKVSQAYARLESMLEETQALIDKLDGDGPATPKGAPAVGAIAAVAPVSPPNSLTPDGNDIAYRGGIYSVWWRR